MSGSGHGWGLDHLPYGVFSVEDERPRVGVRFGDRVLDLHAATGRGCFLEPTLNAFLALGPDAWAETRAEVAELAQAPDTPSYDVGAVHLHLPIEVADYVDFYASLHHATNVGRIFRPDQEPLPPHWRHLPVGYHGRAGTVVVSGTPVVRPSGQVATDGAAPVHAPSRRLDLEAELGFVVGVGSELGDPVAHDDFARHVFGVVGLNDWSARDIQAWEYVPLGPFLAKSFATSISAWVTPLAALEAAWTDLPDQTPRPLDYLAPDRARGLDIDVEVLLGGEVISRPPYSSMYWSPAQMLAHLTVNGASLRTGDLFASGTISGPAPGQRGSLLELSWGGTQPFGEGRTFLEDGDEVVLRYSAPGAGGGRITLGEVAGRVAPAS